MVPGQKVGLIGTIYKEMKGKPNVLSLESKHGAASILGKATSNVEQDTDQIIIEDATGRLKIKPTSNFDAHMAVTGSVVALLGEANSNGEFLVDDYVYAGVNM